MEKAQRNLAPNMLTMRLLCDFRRKNKRFRSAPAGQNSLILLKNSGAGEGIRTLDPNLGNPILRATPELTILRFSTPFQMDIAIAATTQ
jgi:hypothetical protein